LGSLKKCSSIASKKWNGDTTTGERFIGDSCGFDVALTGLCGGC